MSAKNAKKHCCSEAAQEAISNSDASSAKSRQARSPGSRAASSTFGGPVLLRRKEHPPRRYAPPLPKGELKTLPSFARRTVRLRRASTTQDQGGASTTKNRSCQYALRAWEDLRKRQFCLRQARSPRKGRPALPKAGRLALASLGQFHYRASLKRGTDTFF